MSKVSKILFLIAAILLFAYLAGVYAGSGGGGKVCPTTCNSSDTACPKCVASGGDLVLSCSGNKITYQTSSVIRSCENNPESPKNCRVQNEGVLCYYTEDCINGSLAGSYTCEIALGCQSSNWQHSCYPCTTSNRQDSYGNDYECYEN